MNNYYNCSLMAHCFVILFGKAMSYQVFSERKLRAKHEVTLRVTSGGNMNS